MEYDKIDQSQYDETLKSLLTEVTIFYMNSLNQAKVAPDTFTKNSWSAKSQAYQDAINIVKSAFGGGAGLSPLSPIGSLPPGILVNGTVTALQGGGPWAVVTTGTQTVTGSIIAIQGAPWLVDQNNAPWAENLTQINSTPMGAPTSPGTPATGNILSIQGNPSGIPLPISGSFAITPTGTQSVTGTITALQGAPPWYVVSSPTGTQAVSGTVSIAGGVGGSSNIATIASTPIGAPTTAGTAASGTILSIQGNASGIPIPVSGNFSVATSTQGVSGTISALQSGSWNVLAQPTGTQGVSGTITALQGTNPWTVSQLNPPWQVTATALGTFPISGTVTALQGTNPWNENLTNIATTPIGAPTTAGTAASGTILTIQGNPSGVPVPISGTFNVTSTPATGVQFSDVVQIGNTPIGAPTTAGTSASGAILTIQGNPSGVPLPISGTFNVSSTPATGVQFFDLVQVGNTPIGAPTTAGTSASGAILTIQGNPSGIPIPVSGNFSVATSTQGVSGTVTTNQGNAPWQVTATALGTFPVSGTVSALQSGTWTMQQGNPPWSVTTSPTGTQAVSGTITVNQGTSPWVISGNVNASQVGAPWSVTTSPTGTQAVSGTVTALQGTNPWIVNQSGAPWQVTTTALGTFPVSGTVTALQGTLPWTANLINVSSTPIGAPTTAGTSASGTILSMQGNVAGIPLPISGTVSTLQSGNWNVLAQPTGTQGISGTVTTLQGTNPWQVTATALGTFPISGTISALQSGSWTVTSNQGAPPWSVTTSPTGTQAVSGTVTALQGTLPWTANLVNVSSTPIGAPTTAGTAASGAILSMQGNAAGIPLPISGTVSALQSGNWNVLAQPTGTQGISGTVTTLQGTNPWTVNQSGAPWQVTATALGTFPISGTVSALQSGTWTVIANQGTPPWQVTATALGTFPVSGTITALQGTVPWNENLTNIATTPLGAPTTAGTPATGAILTIQGNASGVPLPITGNISASTTYPFVGNTDTQNAPATGVGVGMFGYNGVTGKWDRIRLDSISNQKVDLNAGGTQIGAPTTAGTPATGAILTIQGNASGVPVPISGNISASTTYPFVGNTDTQNAPASGIGVGIFGYNGLTGKWDRITVDPFDALRVDVNAGGTQLGAPTTAGTPATGAILSIQGNASGVPLPTTGTSFVSGGSAGLVNISGSSLNVQAIVGKYTATLTNTTLGANASFTSPWFDASLSGAIFVSAQSYSDKSSSLLGFSIQETSDSSFVNLYTTITSTTALSGIGNTLSAPITQRYWRIVYTNSQSAQTTFELNYSAVQNPPTQPTAMPKFASTLLTTTLTASGTFFSGWMDTIGNGLNHIAVYTFSNVASAPNGVTLLQTNDPNNAVFSNQIGSGTAPASGLFTLQGTISTRYWAINYINGNAGQTSFEVNYTGTNQPIGPPAVASTALYKQRNVNATVTAVKTLPGTLFNVNVINTQTTFPAYLQFFNAATANIVLTQTAPDWEFLIGPNSQVNYAFSSDLGASFNNAISIASTTTEMGGVGSANGVMVWLVYQ